ncbi:MAG: hypothetical protein MI725_05755, partial [Pirellulales bacterium]|nr:hypothetical protein [Pirellulales bacterium]
MLGFGREELELHVERIAAGGHRGPGLLAIASHVDAEGPAVPDGVQDPSDPVGDGIELHTPGATPTRLREDQRRLPTAQEVLYTLDDAGHLLASATPSHRNALGEPSAEPAGPTEGVVGVLRQVPRHAGVIEDVPPAPTQSPRDDSGVGHREVVGADQQRLVVLAHHGAKAPTQLSDVLHPIT